VAATLLTDERAIASHPLAGGFETVLSLPGAGRGEVAKTLDETHLAGCFARLIDWLESAQGRWCVWCHLKGLAAPWDAPLEFRRAYIEEGDPEPPASADVPDRMLPSDFDPDELLGYWQAYAGQVTLLDTCLGALLEFLRTGRLGEDTALVLLSARGFPLGEHGRLGGCDHALYNELVHVPLVLRFPEGLGAAGRSSALVQPSDLGATLLDLWGVRHEELPFGGRSLMPLVREEAEGFRDHLAIAGAGSERAIATPAWYLRMPGAGPDQLFVRPDDRWQVNDVADRCPEVAEQLREAFSRLAQAIQSGQSAQIPPLDEALLVPPE
jgi:arylsulfatase A-like enzyme